jgi:hypothetical protein
MGSKVIAYIDGPIRVTRHVAYWATIGFGIRSTSFEADITYYASFIRSPLTMRIPVKLDLFASEARTDIGTDYNRHGYGLVFINSNNPDGAIIDGRMSPQEEALDLSMDEWRLVAGPQGTYFRGPIPKSELLNQVKISLHYVDDYHIPDPPENEPGHIGHVFDRIDFTHVKPGMYQLEPFLYFPPHYHAGDQDKYLNMENAPLEIAIRTLMR